MRDLTVNEQELYKFLFELEDDEISKDELVKMIGWPEQKFIDVACGIAKDFRDINGNNILGVATTMSSKSDLDKSLYFQHPLVDCALLLESKLVELNHRELYKDRMYQTYLKQWKKFRGY